MHVKIYVLVSLSGLWAVPAWAASTFFSTGTPDGKLATLSRPDTFGQAETETADDFNLSQAMSITQATFTGLIPSGAALSSIASVNIEIYRVFPQDSTVPAGANVPTRANSPSDVEFDGRDSGAATLTFSASLLSSTFTATNSVVNGINPVPGQFTGGEGAVTGQEVMITANFATPVVLPAGHYFFRPEAGLTTGTGNFLWLSAPKPIVAPGTPFDPSATDLQSWIRNTSLSPDWLRIGTDITHQGPFNAAFSLSGDLVAVPLPSAAWMGLSVLGAMGLISRRGSKVTHA